MQKILIKRTFRLSLLFYFSILVSSSLTSQGPYQYNCNPGINNYPEYWENGFIHVDVNFNDPDGDCISDDFEINFTHSSGVIETWHNNNGDNGGPIDFDEQGCCPDEPIGGHDSGGGSDACDCTWSVNSAGVIIIYCPCNPV